MKKYNWFLLVFCLFIIPWYGQAETQQEVLQQQVINWATQLSEKDSRFASLNTAELSYQPLDHDPNQWLVTFTSGHQDIAYMVIGTDKRLYSLMEYGLGEYTLFDEEPVVSLPSDSSTRTSHYAGLQSVWVSEEGLYDAKSGEKYPSDTKVPSLALTAFTEQNDKLTAIGRSKPSDQTGAWIKPGEMVKTEKDFLYSVDHGISLTYIGHLFDGTVLAPFTVLGFHQWENVLFIELEDDGSRFVPIQHALDLGAFYK